MTNHTSKFGPSGTKPTKTNSGENLYKIINNNYNHIHISQNSLSAKMIS